MEYSIRVKGVDIQTGFFTFTMQGLLPVQVKDAITVIMGIAGMTEVTILPDKKV